MKIERIELHHISLPYVHPFKTSMSVETSRDCILAAVYADGLVGWGECVSSMGPWYSAETITTSWHILNDILCPNLIGQQINPDNPGDVPAIMSKVRGLPMTVATLENAFWDVAAQAKNQSLAQFLGGVRDRVPVGVSIGIQPSVEQLVARVGKFIDEGYNRIKCKIDPVWHLEPLQAVRNAYPTVQIMADANSAYTLDDVDLLRELDQLDLLMIEQPLSHDDIADHARLQTQLQTPICLDESIHGVADTQAAIDLRACQVINVKVGRVGGLGNVVKIHTLCEAADIKVWCGGMFETGVGRATNVHLATLPNFVLPGDISATDRYYHEDIADPPFVLNKEDSTMSVSTAPGIGVTVNMERIKETRVRKSVFC